MGSSFIFDPAYINVSVPGKAIKKPKTAEVPTASCIFFENIVKIGTLKLPPPIPIIDEKKPINKLIKKFINFDNGRSEFNKIGLCWKSIFIEIKNAKITNIITRFSPDIKLAEREPKTDPAIIPNAHFFTMFKFVFFNLKWDLIDANEVKHITPSDEATAKCITTSEL